MSGPSPTIRVAIIIAARNSAPWLPATLQSLLSQTESSWHCWIVDDRSSDGTAELGRQWAAKDERITVLTGPGVGVSAARNCALREAGLRCDYTAILDSDDVWAPDALERLIAVLESRPDAVGVSALAVTIDQVGNAISPDAHAAKLLHRVIYKGMRLRVLAVGEDTTFESQATAGRIWPPAVCLLRTSVLTETGLFDECLESSEDWDLFLRMSRRGPFAFLPQVIAQYRIREGSITSGDARRMTYFCDMVRRKTYFSSENTSHQRSAVKKGWRAVQFRALWMAADAMIRHLREGSVSLTVDEIRQVKELLVTLLSGEPPLARLSHAYHRSGMIAAVQPPSNQSRGKAALRG